MMCVVFCSSSLFCSCVSFCVLFNCFVWWMIAALGGAVEKVKVFVTNKGVGRKWANLKVVMK